MPNSNPPENSKPDDAQLAQDEHDREMAKLPKAKRDAFLDELIDVARKKQTIKKRTASGGP